MEKSSISLNHTNIDEEEPEREEEKLISPNMKSPRISLSRTLPQLTKNLLKFFQLVRFFNKWKTTMMVTWKNQNKNIVFKEKRAGDWNSNEKAIITK